MPPKAKKKRASLKLDPSGEIKADAPVEEVKAPPVRQVVEVVEDTDVPEAIDTIKRDTEEIETAVETIEEEVEKAEEMVEPALSGDTEVTPPEEKQSVEALFTKSSPAVNPEITVVGKSGASLGVWVGAMLGVALAIGVSLVLLVRGPKTLSFLPSAKPTPTPSPTSAPLPTPTPSVNKKDIKVSVLNGGGVAGAGSKMKALLEEKGYTVSTVGNAKDYSYTDTEVQVKAGKSDLQAMVVADLSSYSAKASATTLKDSDKNDVVVIVGKGDSTSTP